MVNRTVVCNYRIFCEYCKILDTFLLISTWIHLVNSIDHNTPTNKIVYNHSITYSAKAKFSPTLSRDRALSTHVIILKGENHHNSVTHMKILNYMKIVKMSMAI